ncbi:MAG: PmoA family protein [Planctomycetaceae bacterium]|nr:PmoA family protein [Planctomycetaceae bacterium]
MNTTQYKLVIITLIFLLPLVALHANETTQFSVPAKDGTVGNEKTPFVADAVPQQEAAKGFRFADAGTNTIALFEGDEPVYHYIYDLITNENVPEKEVRRRTRGCYMHPLFGINGEVLTDDFPQDHYHHHGLFWCWPHVQIGDEHHDFWNETTDLEQRFVKWLVKEAGDDGAVLAVENGWFIGERKVMTERVWFRSYRKRDGSRSLDVQLFFVPEETITLRGAEGKSYGGLCIRFKPELAPPGNSMERTIAKITVPDGITANDLPEERLEWADFASKFDGRETVSGAAIFIPPTHPDYPPTWLTRHYGPLCVGWPGIHDRTFEPGVPFSLEYRIWVHETDLDLQQLTDAYQAYVKESGQ